MNNKVSNDFYREEFACSCGCGFNAVDVFLLEVLQDLRSHFGVRVDIKGGNRCWKNHVRIYKLLKLGNPIKNSAHLKGMAADIKVYGVSPVMVKAYLDKKWGNRVCIGLYKSFVHIDVRKGGKRW